LPTYILQNKSRCELKCLFLDFLDDHELSSKEINDDVGDNEMLKLEVIPITYKVFKDQKKCIGHAERLIGWIFEGIYGLWCYGFLVRL
jgi:hypothetical protein